MKVQCDVCAVEAASVLCCADEAALCDACDRRIHSANKLAGKHRRLSLLHPSPSSSSPLCDICQERRGFLFCQEDRAILCRDCDIPIHTTNNLTMNHHRFLLPGVRLSSAPIPSAPPSEAEVADKKTNDDDAKIKNNCCESNKNAVAAEEEADCSSSTTTAAAAAAAAAVGSNSSSISEYLIKMLPGWHVEDFLTDDAVIAADADAFSQVNGDLLKSDSVLSGLEEGPPIWVPQAKPPAVGGQTGRLFQGFLGSKASRQRWSEGYWTVPQMRENKRCRTAVWYS